MGKVSNIEWCDATHNFWYGCRKISEGCKHCFVERDMKRFKKGFNTITRAKDFTAPLKWKEPKRIFTCSWSDFFLTDADDWRSEAWNIISSTPQHTYLILTKRPENIPSKLPWDWGNGYKNVWLGVSAENQMRAEQRIPLLLSVPAAKYFVSAEPLLTLVNFEKWMFRCPSCGESPVLDERWRFNGERWEHHHDYPAGHIESIPTHAIDWVIVGGESGPEYRPMSATWALNILHQCHTAETAFFFKQMGGWPDKGGSLDSIPVALRVREFPNA